MWYRYKNNIYHFEKFDIINKSLIQVVNHAGDLVKT